MIRRGQLKKKYVGCQAMRVINDKKKPVTDNELTFEYRIRMGARENYLTKVEVLNIIDECGFIVLRLFDNNKHFQSLVNTMMNLVQGRIQFELFNTGSPDDEKWIASPYCGFPNNITATKVEQDHDCGIDVGDKKRKHWYVERMEIPELIQKMDDAVRQLFPTLSGFNPVLLHSLGGCAKQQPHIDWPYYNVSIQKHHHYGSMPMSAVLATESHSKLDLWEKSHHLVKKYIEGDRDQWIHEPTIRSKIINIPKGCMIIFRQDLVHAGSHYSKENIRLFQYYNSNTMKTVANSIKLLESYGTEFNQKFID